MYRRIIFTFQDTRTWRYGERSKFIVKPRLVEQLAVHRKQKSVAGYQVAVVDSNVAELHHYRNFVSKNKKRGGKDEYKKLSHVEDTVMVTRFVRQLITRVENACQIIQNIQCRFVYFDI